ncbi:hypothetical protein [Mycolicibacterium vinylchloridicum]|uniref:hypothetical protein n=1 Tax=Mycolicibacterium vinylchloridicum TaxID=2736928 RepID=UPI002D800DC1|nr:hypothetical protein [Mycolicibacterium vinylchloridicum]
MAAVRSSGRGGSLIWIAISAVVLAALLVVVIVSITRHAGGRKVNTDAASLDHPPAVTAVGVDSSPPWPAPGDTVAAVAAAGLPMLTQEGAQEHIHAHLDVLVDGQPVAVPANIGVDQRRGRISPLHTHDDSGVIHIESPVKRQFSIGELFSEWQVSLTADNIGALRAGDGKVLRVFVNGKQQAQDPAAFLFNTHDEIAIVYGVPRTGENIPAKYDFAEGE